MRRPAALAGARIDMPGPAIGDDAVVRPEYRRQHRRDMREGVPIGVIEVTEDRRDPELAELGDAVREPVDRDGPGDGIELQVALAAHLAEPGLALLGQPAAGIAAA